MALQGFVRLCLWASVCVQPLLISSSVSLGHVLMRHFDLGHVLMRHVDLSTPSTPSSQRAPSTPSRPKDSCALPMPPSHDFGIFESKDNIALPEKLLKSLPLQGDFMHIAPLFRKLSRGLRGKVIVIGGSETQGQQCDQNATVNGTLVKLTLKTCSWPARFAQWLQASFPRAQVENLAMGGCGTVVFYEALSGILQKHHDADLVILDTAVNDKFDVDHRPRQDKRPGKTDKNYMSVMYERLILAVRTILPKAGIFVFAAPVWEGEAVRADQISVAQHHNLPMLDMLPLFKQENLTYQWLHPRAPTHQVFAVLLVTLCAKAWSQLCPGSAQPPALNKETLWPEAAKLETCLQPLSRYSARDASTSRPKVVSGDWRLYEDRPGKPGWIASTPGSRLRFVLKLGLEARFAVTYLRSYQNVSDILVSMGNRTFILKGRWDPEFKERISVPEVVWFKAMPQKSVAAQAKAMFENSAHSLMQDVKLGQRAKVKVELKLMETIGQDTQKAKIIDVVSC